jgi:riboflavin synthase
MFTGIVEAVGCVSDVTHQLGSARIAIASPLIGGEIGLGESIAVDGVCLTVAAHSEGNLVFEAVPETLSRTTLDSIGPGTVVNLERALRVGDRLGGHWVQGHVDAVAVVDSVREDGDDRRVSVILPAEIRRFVAGKGSITLQGVSLTVSALDADRCEVALVPFTLRRTTLGKTRAGDRLNVEVDLLARYLDRILEVRAETN